MSSPIKSIKDTDATLMMIVDKTKPDMKYFFPLRLNKTTTIAKRTPTNVVLAIIEPTAAMKIKESISTTDLMSETFRSIMIKMKAWMVPERKKCVPKPTILVAALSIASFAISDS